MLAHSKAYWEGMHREIPSRLGDPSIWSCDPAGDRAAQSLRTGDSFPHRSGQPCVETNHPEGVGLAQPRTRDCDDALGQVSWIRVGKSSLVYVRDLNAEVTEAPGLAHYPPPGW